MLRICKRNCNMYNRSKTIDFFSAAHTFSIHQDTIQNNSVSNKSLVEDSIIKGEMSTQNDSLIVEPVKQINFSAIDSILRKSEEREKQIQEQVQREAAIKKWRNRKIDTTEILYKEFGIAGFPINEKLSKDPFQQNFLYNLSAIKPTENKSKQTVFIESGNDSRSQNYNTAVKENLEVKPKVIPGRIHFDWITILLIGSFFLLGWIRLFNKKYLSSLVKSIVSYKESYNLYRDKNSLMERASFMVNLLFLSNVSVFVIQMKHYWGFNLGGTDDYIIYFIVLASLVGLYIYRAIMSAFIGYVFMKQKVFSEYFHNVNIFTKNTGLFLFPVIIVLQFLTYEYLTIIVFSGIFLISLLYFFQIMRSFQIIIRKNVSILYMILYLCAFEFAPFLVIYKILLSLS